MQPPKHIQLAKRFNREALDNLLSLSKDTGSAWFEVLRPHTETIEKAIKYQEVNPR